MEKNCVGCAKSNCTTLCERSPAEYQGWVKVEIEANAEQRKCVLCRKENPTVYITSQFGLTARVCNSCLNAGFYYNAGRGPIWINSLSNCSEKEEISERDCNISYGKDVSGFGQE